ncbi:DNA-binding protein [Amycolatopsis acidicola]|uniref:DNA-binding protein n=1 Tax=Amycolatopsis acidicola TaxID=2596893 RepID=A0A5N0UYD7_9PSEU|nr:OB-fold domain-containing protein [Amycolatopsis acidicola]KAA9156356.1 DNA-binding protein [Amycolatopsis acidicola]
MTLPEPVETIEAPLKMEYTYVAGVGRSVYLHGMARKAFLARRCPRCRMVYFPAPEQCARCLAPLDEPFELPGTGEIDTFCVVNFPFPGQLYKPPYVVAHINLHGTGTRLMHRIMEIDPADVALGQEVEPVWVADDALEPSLASVRYFRPRDPALRVPLPEEDSADA